jgi:hypothetical protein
MNVVARCRLLFAAVLLGPLAVLADELPKDTNTIKSLTAEQARKLVAGLMGPQLSLGGLAALDAETAAALAEFKGRWLHLNGLVALDADTAKALAGFRGESLQLLGLAGLDTDAVKALATFSGQLQVAPKALERFRATHPFCKEVAFEYAVLCRGGLSFLTMLDADTARAVAEYKGDQLWFKGLKAIDADTAEALAEFNGRSLVLSGVTALDPATAKALGQGRSAHLILDGLTALDADTASALAGFEGSLYLNGLTRLDDETAGALVEFKGKLLHLGGLDGLDADTAELFAESKVVVEIPRFFAGLGGKVPLTLALARLAARSESCVGLPGVTALESPDSVAIAQALAARNGPLALPNLKKISPRTLSALIEKEDVKIPLIETLELIPEPDGGPNDDFVIPKRFQNRQEKQRWSRGR